MYYGTLDKRVIPLKIYAITKALYGHTPIEYQKSIFYLIWGTVAVETRCSTYKDKTRGYAGEGLTQFDKIPFSDIKKRTSSSTRNTIASKFAMDLKKWKWENLSFNDSKALIMSFCFYKLVREKFPAPYSAQAHAKYWKKYYNTVLGKGTTEKYVAAFKKYCDPDMFEKLEKWAI